MPLKFESITFTTKDIVAILGGASMLFTFYSSIDNRMDAFELKIQKIMSDSDFNKFELNAKIESLKHSDNNAKRIIQHTFFAIRPDTELQVKKKKLFKYTLV